MEVHTETVVLAPVLDEPFCVGRRKGNADSRVPGGHGDFVGDLLAHPRLVDLDLIDDISLGAVERVCSVVRSVAISENGNFDRRLRLATIQDVNRPKTDAWRRILTERESVRTACSKSEERDRSEEVTTRGRGGHYWLVVRAPYEHSGKPIDSHSVLQQPVPLGLVDNHALHVKE